MDVRAKRNICRQFDLERLRQFRWRQLTLKKDSMSISGFVNFNGVSFLATKKEYLLAVRFGEASSISMASVDAKKRFNDDIRIRQFQWCQLF